MAEEVIWWHNGRSNSENYNKELNLKNAGKSHFLQ